MPFLHHIGTAVPGFAHSQPDIVAFMQHHYGRSPEDRRRIAFMSRASGIEMRYSALPDFSARHGAPVLYGGVEAASTSARMAAYGRAALPLATAAVLNTGLPAAGATHLITVSCTGMSAPGLDISLAAHLGLAPGTERASVHFMGCYAALHGLRQAAYICRAEPEAQVLLVCVELCTLHFQLEPTLDNVHATLLFADGAAACWVSGRRPAAGPAGHIRGFWSGLAAEGLGDMAWHVGDTGFLMTLRSEVPGHIGRGAAAWLAQAAARWGIEPGAIEQWAIHPGGKRILTQAAAALGLPAAATEASEAVLREFGNMSSPTILFVLARMLAAPGGAGLGAAVAFGPGLSAEWMCWSPA